MCWVIEHRQLTYQQWPDECRRTRTCRQDYACTLVVAVVELHTVSARLSHPVHSALEDPPIVSDGRVGTRRWNANILAGLCLYYCHTITSGCCLFVVSCDAP